MYIAEQRLLAKFGANPWPSWVERPRELDWLLTRRNYSLLVVIAASLISIPRWQSIIGLIGVVLFIIYLSGQ
jgi:hypothetical protein